jgi:hypothetical protein
MEKVSLEPAVARQLATAALAPADHVYVLHGLTMLQQPTEVSSVRHITLHDLGYRTTLIACSAIDRTFHGQSGSQVIYRDRAVFLFL